MTIKIDRNRKKKKREWSKTITLIVILCGAAIVQECFILMYICITSGYEATAAWLTAAVGLAEVVIATGLSGYLSLCKVDHSAGGITYEKAKAKEFKEEEESI